MKKLGITCIILCTSLVYATDYTLNITNNTRCTLENIISYDTLHSAPHTAAKAIGSNTSGTIHVTEDYTVTLDRYNVRCADNKVVDTIDISIMVLVDQVDLNYANTSNETTVQFVDNQLVLTHN